MVRLIARLLIIREFRFKWDANAQWFGIEQVLY